jgi:polysaccharide export outer membrane protein
MGLDDYEIPKGQFAHASIVDANGIPQLHPQSPPAELSKISLPDYIIEPPDILLIEGIKVVPKAPYEIQPQDVLQIVVLGTQPERPIAGQFLVEGSGVVNLGPGYGAVRIAGLTTDEASEEIRDRLLRELNNVEVAVTIFQTSGQQFITGEHLVAPDGTVNLGLYGRVYLAGMSLDEGRGKIEERLSLYFDDPKVSLDVFVYNSKFYYIISAGGGVGDRVVRIPVTGNETVLDAIAQVGGLDQSSSKKMWIARPTPGSVGCDQILPVDWDAITRVGATATNYQLLAGDRLFIAENPAIAWANLTSIFLNPFERVIGFSLLGAQTVQTLQRFPEGFTRGLGQ